jgi:hypothetical protein
MFGEVGQPQLIRRLGSEVSAHQILMHWWARLAGLAPLLVPEYREPAVGRADPPRRARSHHLARIGGLVGQEPVAELRVITMSVEQGIRPIRLGQLRFGHLMGQPPVILAGERASLPDTRP